MSDNPGDAVPYSEWAKESVLRAADAANTFGSHLIQHCRQAALGKLPADASPRVREVVESAVDTALHNVCDLLEGFLPTMAGSQNKISYSLVVNVSNLDHSPVESIPISPSLLDLPIAYWKWRDGDFR